MKKVVSILLIIVLGFHSSLKATSTFLTDEVSNVKTSKLSNGFKEVTQALEEPGTTRNWSKQIKLLGTGLALLMASYIAESAISNDSVNKLILMATTYCITTSLATLIRYCLEWYGESLAKAQYGPKQRGSQKGKMTQKQVEKCEQAAQNNIRLTRVFFRQTQNLMNAALKISALYVIFQNDDFSAPLKSLLFTSSITGGFIYNLNEVRHTYKMGQVRKDIPILGIIDGVCEVLVAVTLFNYWQDRGLEIAPGLFLPIRMPLTSSQWAFYRFLQIHGDLQAVGNALQLPINVVSGLQSYFKRAPQIIEHHIKSPVVSPPALQPTMANLSPTKASNRESNIRLNSETNFYQPAFEQTNYRSLKTHEQPLQKKVKIKTRGTSRASLPTITPTPEGEPEDIPSVKDIMRQEALEKIQELRQSTTIKEATINQEIRQLLAFLTDARLENLGHGKRAIVISFKDGKSFRIIFEPPHEQSNASSDEYKGYRKTRVLDALQVGYLYGWDETKILAFMNANNINRFYNIPYFLIDILWKRGQYQ